MTMGLFGRRERRRLKESSKRLKDPAIVTGQSRQIPVMVNRVDPNLVSICGADVEFSNAVTFSKLVMFPSSKVTFPI